jgi:sugar phosphate isomerase/epimerase
MIGIQLYTVRDLLTCEDACDKTIAALGEMGYECIQLFGGTAMLDTMKYCVRAARKYGLKVIGWLTNPDALSESFDEITEIAREAEARDIGISGGAKNEKDARELVEKANAFAKKINDAGFSFSYHNHSHEFIRTECGETVMDILLNGFDSELVDLMPDTYWLQHGGVDVRDFIETYAERIKILHLKDMKRVADGVTFSEVGEGNLNMKGIIKCALENGISTFIVEQDLCDGNPVDSARISYKNISEILGEG